MSVLGRSVNPSITVINFHQPNPSMTAINFQPWHSLRCFRNLSVKTCFLAGHHSPRIWLVMMDEPKAVIVNFIVIEKIKIKRSKLFFSKKRRSKLCTDWDDQNQKKQTMYTLLPTLMSTSALLLRPSYLFSHNLP